MITLLSILFLGFFLGLKHATDADHVIAVTTIVSRQRSVGSAALTGVFWGIGHSLTLLVVGGAIILFGIVIPERLGLSMEFCVALMLILLGALNLRVTTRALRSGAPGDQHHDMRTGMAITLIPTRTDTVAQRMAMPTTPSHLRAWTASSVASDGSRN